MLVASVTALAEDVKERTLKFAFSLVKDHPLGLGVQTLAYLVAQKGSRKIRFPFTRTPCLVAIR